MHVRVGVGGRMDTLQCAIVLAKLERFDWELERRRRSRPSTRVGCPRIDGMQLPVVRSDRDSAWAQYTVMVDARDECSSGCAMRHSDGGALPAATESPAGLLRPGKC